MILVSFLHLIETICARHQYYYSGRMQILLCHSVLPQKCYEALKCCHACGCVVLLVTYTNVCVTYL